MTWRFKKDMWRMKAGDPVPAHKLDELKTIAPEAIYNDAPETKAADASYTKFAGKSPRDK